MIKYVVYLDSGEIVRTGSAPDGQAEIQAGYGENLLLNATADDATQYVAGEMVLDKKPFPAVLEDNVVAANGTDFARLSYIPYDSTIIVNDITAETYSIRDGEFDLSVDMPGIYVLKCYHPRYLDGEYAIEGFSP